MRMPAKQVDLSGAFSMVVERRRKAQKLSRNALAQKAGVDQTYVGLLERGLRSPSLDTAERIAKALGLKLSGMLSEAEKIRR